MAATSTTPTNQEVQAFRKTLLADFKLMCLSREASLLGRKEVLTGKAKFGIFGDGKEMAQVHSPRCCSRAIGAPGTTGTKR